MDKVLRDIEKIRTTKNEQKDKKILEDELKRVKDEQMKVLAKKKVEKLQMEHGVLPLASKKTLLTSNKHNSINRGVSLDNRNTTLH